MTEPSSTPPEPTPREPAPSASSPGPSASDLAPAPAANGHRFSGTSLVIGLLVAAFVTVGAVFAFRSATGPDPIAARIPADASLVVQVTLQPSIEQRRALGAIADRSEGGREQLETTLDDAVDGILGSLPGNLSAEEVRGFVGDQVAFVAWRDDETADLSPIAIAHLADPEAATEAIAGLTGLTARIDTGFLYLAQSDAELDAFLRAASNQPLVRDRRFRTARERVGGDGLVLVRADVDDALEVAGTTIGDQGSVLAGIRAHDEAIEVTILEEDELLSAPLPSPVRLDLLDDVAEHAHAAFGFTDLASIARQAEGLGVEEALGGLDLESALLSWLGDQAAIAFGVFDEGLVIAAEVVASDPVAMRSFVTTARGLVEAFVEDARVTGSEDAFTVRTPQAEVTVTVDGDRLSIQARDTDVAATIDDLPALEGIPTEPVSFGGAVNLAALLEVFVGGDDDLPLALPDTLSIATSVDEIGPVLSLRFTFRD